MISTARLLNGFKRAKCSLSSRLSTDESGAKRGRRGDDPLRIKQRAGHRSFSTTEGYIREAENLREGFGEVFPPLPESLFGDAEVSDQIQGLGSETLTKQQKIQAILWSRRESNRSTRRRGASSIVARNARTTHRNATPRDASVSSIGPVQVGSGPSSKVSASQCG